MTQSEIIFFDENDDIVDSKDATKYEYLEYSDSGKLINIAHGRVG